MYQFEIQFDYYVEPPPIYKPYLMSVYLINPLLFP